MAERDRGDGSFNWYSGENKAASLRITVSRMFPGLLTCMQRCELCERESSLK